MTTNTRMACALAVASLALVASPQGARGAIVGGASRKVTGRAMTRLIPAWARKYNANCSMCHSPAVPRLNARGIQFKWAGYRMPEEIGENAEVNRLQDFVAARMRFQYQYEKASGTPTETNGFSIDNLSLFVGGAIGKRYGGLMELERNPDGEVEALVSASSVWGSERRFGGVRAGQGHMLLLGGGVAGFDRSIGISQPLPFGSANTAVPLNLGGDISGVEAFYVAGANRTSVQIVNAVGNEESGLRSTSKDLVLTDQFVWDAAGAGVGAALYFGGTRGLAPDASSVRSRYSRLAFTANKYFGNFEVLGAYVVSRDRDLPVSETFARDRVNAQSYWFSGQYTFRPSPLTLFSRWEFRDPDGDSSNDADQRFVAGGVLPINLPEYLRLALEFRRDLPQGGSRPRRNGLAAELQLTF